MQLVPCMDMDGSLNLNLARASEIIKISGELQADLSRGKFLSYWLLTTPYIIYPKYALMLSHMTEPIRSEASLENYSGIVVQACNHIYTLVGNELTLLVWGSLRLAPKV